MPLRPLGVSDFFDATFKTMRRYIAPTLGVGFALALVTAVISMVAMLVFVDPGQMRVLNPGNMADPNNPIQGIEDIVGDGDLTYFMIQMAGALLLGVTQLLVSGMVATVAMSATVGEPLTLGQAWARVRPRLVQLLLLTLLTFTVGLLGLMISAGIGYATYVAATSIFAGVVVGILALLLTTVISLFLTVRYFALAGPAIVIERASVGQALRRAGALSRQQFWRILGIYLLLSIVIGFGVGLLAMPFSIGAAAAQTGLGGDTGMILYMILNQLGTLLTTAISAPLSGLVACLLYLDQRFRKEAFDVTLINYVEARRQAAS